MKAKKVLAMLMASAMIMGTSVTAFAAGENSTITITNGADSTFKYYQIIVTAPQKETGWDFSNDSVAGAYKTAFGEDDTQTIIQQMINKEDGIDSKIAAALANVKALASGEDPVIDLVSVSDDNPDDTDFTFEVDNAGVYYIEGAANDYTYSPMAAYVSFGETDGKYDPAKLEDAEPINAKRQPNNIEKNADDQVVEIGRNVEYTIESVVPYVGPGEKFTITDNIKGADYAVADGKLSVKVYFGKDADEINAGTPVDATIEVEPTGYVPEKGDPADEFDSTFTVDLTNYIANRVNQKVVLVYGATVTDLQVNNKVLQGNGTHDYADDTETVDTAVLNLHKTGDESVDLKDAKFVLMSSDDKYATFTTDSDGNYILTGTWEDDYKAGTEDTDTDEDGFIDNTVIITDEDGMAVIKGLDGELEYTLVEVEAPNGYSLADDTTLTPFVTDVENEYWDNESLGNVTINDTTLAELPSTGGIGTTIFTIGGCAIMVTAAGLYFATRKKTEK